MENYRVLKVVVEDSFRCILILSLAVQIDSHNNHLPLVKKLTAALLLGLVLGEIDG